MNLDIEKLRELHTLGWDQQHIAQVLMVERSTVSRWVKELGLDGRAAKTAKGDARIRELHAQGLSQKDIARALGLERSSVSRRLGVMGLRTARSRLEQIAGLDLKLPGAFPEHPDPPFSAPPASGFIYFVGSTSFVKIGFSCADLRSRLSNLRVANPQLRVLATAEVDDAPATERRLHERFAGLRDQGEWFRCEGELADLLEQLKRLAAKVVLLLG